MNKVSRRWVLKSAAGVLGGNLIGYLTSVAIALTFLRSRIAVRPSRADLAALARYGLPILPANIQQRAT